MTTITETLVAIGTGAIFGLALDKAHTNVPAVIQEQMEMRNFTMMRMFLAASATSTLAVLGLHVTNLKKRTPTCVCKSGYGGNFLGGALLGAGMYFSGSCPGTIWSAIGAGIPFTPAVLAGGVSGALLYGYVLDKYITEKEKKPETDLIPSIPYEIAALILASAMFGAISLVDLFFPWQMSQTRIVLEDPNLADYYDSPYSLSRSSWDPLLSGALLGLIQIPIQLTRGGALGQSSGYLLIAGKLASSLDRNFEENSPYLAGAIKGFKPGFQLLKSGGIIAGALLSQYAANYPALSPEFSMGAGSYARGFVGGFLMLLGARMGNGCTSGHGLSGMATLSRASVVSVMGMFTGGMLVAAVSGTFDYRFMSQIV